MTTCSEQWEGQTRSPVGGEGGGSQGAFRQEGHLRSWRGWPSAGVLSLNSGGHLPLSGWVTLGKVFAISLWLSHGDGKT